MEVMQSSCATRWLPRAKFVQLRRITRVLKQGFSRDLQQSTSRLSTGRKPMKTGRRQEETRTKLSLSSYRICGGTVAVRECPPPIATVPSIKEKHRSFIFFIANARQEAGLQNYATGTPVARALYSHFLRPAGRLPHATAEDSHPARYTLHAPLRHGTPTQRSQTAGVWPRRKTPWPRCLAADLATALPQTLPLQCAVWFFPTTRTARGPQGRRRFPTRRFATSRLDRSLVSPGWPPRQHLATGGPLPPRSTRPGGGPRPWPRAPLTSL